jgi:hypothetical protein
MSHSGVAIGYGVAEALIGAKRQEGADSGAVHNAQNGLLRNTAPEKDELQRPINRPPSLTNCPSTTLIVKPVLQRTPIRRLDSGAHPRLRTDEPWTYFEAIEDTQLAGL